MARKSVALERDFATRVAPTGEGRCFYLTKWTPLAARQRAAGDGAESPTERRLEFRATLTGRGYVNVDAAKKSQRTRLFSTPWASEDSP
jgi:hypothetical protein